MKVDANPPIVASSAQRAEASQAKAPAESLQREQAREDAQKSRVAASTSGTSSSPARPALSDQMARALSSRLVKDQKADEQKLEEKSESAQKTSRDGVIPGLSRNPLE